MGRLVKQGSKGADVRAIQDVLNFHIRRLEPLAVDGDFGPRTHARVVEFQKVNALKADGIVGPRTMTKLFEEEQLPNSIQEVIGVAVVNGAADVESVGRPALLPTQQNAPQHQILTLAGPPS